MSSAAFSPSIPQVNPKLYEEIFDTSCEHEFKKGGYGRNRGFLIFGIHADGSFGEWAMYLPRIEVIEALYEAFAKTRNKDTAVFIYRLIESACPINGWNPGLVRYYLNKDADETQILAEIKELLKNDPVAFGQASNMFELRSMTKRLRAVETDEEFRNIQEEFSTKLLPISEKK
jgi:hypothetical protein